MPRICVPLGIFTQILDIVVCVFVGGVVVECQMEAETSSVDDVPQSKISWKQCVSESRRQPGCFASCVKGAV